MYDVIIIGAGPAGLTATYELSKNNKKVLLLEKKENVGGLAETKTFGKYRYDIGPHRFFTKNNEINDLFLKVLDKDAVKVNRKTRILFNGKYFDYPLTPINALFGLGIVESFQIGFSYIIARLKSKMKIIKINNFEDWVIDRFGKKLYSNFFKNYTEKVWGIECREIGKDWAAQRIKGLSLFTAIKFAIFPNSKKRPKSLVDSFYYPRLGAGMMWEKFEKLIMSEYHEFSTIFKSSNVISIKKEDNLFIVEVENENDKQKIYKSKSLFFSNPLLSFVDIFKGNIPKEVIEARKNLNYRNHISVHLAIDKKLFDDNWIYIHSPEIKMARISDFTNFSEHMSSNKEYPLTLEYFCFENEDIWNKSDEFIINLGVKELKKLFKDEFNVLHSAVSRNSKAYPVIKTGYETYIGIIKDWIEKQDNLVPIGRSGMFKYNNQDHAMATGLYAARNLIGTEKYDIWQVNVDGEYHEEVQSNQ